MMSLAAVFFVGVLAGASVEGAPDDGFWNQSFGNGGGSGSVAVEPIEAAPEVLWQSDVGPVVSDPVVWGSTVFVATNEKGKLSLLALDATGGEKLASVALGRMEDPQVRLAVWMSKVVVLDREEVRGYDFKGTGLRKKWSLDLASTSPAAVDDGVLYVNDSARRLVAVDIERGKLIGDAAGGWGRPCVSESQVVTGMTSGLAGFQGVYLQGLFSNKPVQARRKFEWSPNTGSQQFGMAPGVGPDPQDFTVVYAPEGMPYSELFYMRDGAYATLALSDGGPGFLAPAVGRPLAYAGSFYTCSAAGITREAFDGKQYTLMEGSNFPSEVRLGPASRAGHVVYSGNLAFDLERKRLIWLLEDMPLGGPLIPLADGRALRRTVGNELLAFGASGSAEDGAAPVSGAVQSARPDAGIGLILATGEVVLGAVKTGTDDDLQLTPTAGEPHAYGRSEVALVLGATPADAAPISSEYAVRQAWQRALEQALAEDLAQHFAAYERAKLAGECHRLLAELEVLGGERFTDFTQRAANLRESTAGNAGLKREKTGRLEFEARSRYSEELVAAARWCLDAQLAEAATLLVLDAHDSVRATTDFLTTFAFQSVRPPLPPGPLELPDELTLDALAPSNFPFDGASRGELWGQWAREISPAAAHFVAASEAGFPSGLVAPWTEDTIVLTTRNMTLVSRCLDPAIVGSVLRNGEGGLEQLAELFGQEDVEATPLEVRLHKNRTDYLADAARTGKGLGWTLGYYSPAEHISRFYVPDRNVSSSSAGLSQTLWQVVVHELTHQYVTERAGFRARQNGPQPGHWIVEGFARFVEHQAVELGRTGRGLTDPTVLSIDLTAQLAQAGGLIPLERLLAMDYEGFGALSGEASIEVKPRYSMGTYVLNERSIYYSEAGALCFFLVNRRGPEGADRLLAYLRARYESSLPEAHWKLLGFESVAELDAAFRAFLAHPR